jgi:hypothetical protein
MTKEEILHLEDISKNDSLRDDLIEFIILRKEAKARKRQRKKEESVAIKNIVNIVKRAVGELNEQRKNS